MKQEVFQHDPSGDIIASIEEIGKEDPNHAISETTCAIGELYKERIDGEVLEAEVFGQSSAISRSVNGLEQFLKADGESKDQIEEEDHIKVLESKALKLPKNIYQGDDNRI